MSWEVVVGWWDCVEKWHTLLPPAPRGHPERQVGPHFGFRRFGFLWDPNWWPIRRPKTIDIIRDIDMFDIDGNIPLPQLHKSD